MAVRHHVIARQPAAVWAVLEDPSRYSDWVVGTEDSRPADGEWPQLDSSLTYTVKLGHRRFEGRTTVRRYEPPHRLELEAHSGLLGSARISLEVRPWGHQCLVIVDEHPLRGLGGQLHNTLVDALLQIRHRDMLGRLARLVENTPVGTDRKARPVDA